jgi:hypothetical protein
MNSKMTGDEQKKNGTTFNDQSPCRPPKEIPSNSRVGNTKVRRDGIMMTNKTPDITPST